MTPVEQLEQFVKSRLAGATVETDSYPAGSVWFLVKTPQRAIVVEYRRDKGFGVGATLPIGDATAGYGDRPSHILNDIEEVQAHLLKELAPDVPISLSGSTARPAHQDIGFVGNETVRGQREHHRRGRRHPSMVSHRGILSIVDCAAFQRLRRMVQAPFLDAVFPAAVHTRFDHSLGVLSAAQEAIQSLMGDEIFAGKFSDDDAKAFLLAALLHDVGQYPFSSLCEQYAEHRFGDRHEIIESASVVHQSIAFLSDNRELADSIDAYWGLSARRTAIQVLRGEKGVLSQLIYGTIDCDRIDYVLRDAWHCGIQSPASVDPFVVIQSFRCSREGTWLGISEDGLVPAVALMRVQREVASTAYWHPLVRAAATVYQAVLSGLVGDDVEAFRRISNRIKECTTEDEAVERVMIPEAQGLRDVTQREYLLRLLHARKRRDPGDLFVLIAEFPDVVPEFTVLIAPLEHATDVRRHNRLLRSRWVNAIEDAFIKAFRTRRIGLDNSHLVIDAPRGGGGQPELDVVPNTASRAAVSRAPSATFQELLGTSLASPVRAYLAAEKWGIVKDELPEILRMVAGDLRKAS